MVTIHSLVLLVTPFDKLTLLRADQSSNMNLRWSMWWRQTTSNTLLSLCLTKSNLTSFSAIAKTVKLYIYLDNIQLNVTVNCSHWQVRESSDVFYTKGIGSDASVSSTSINMKILLGKINAKLGWEDVFKLAGGNASVCETSNDNCVRVVNFSTSKNPTVKSTMFRNYYFHKYTKT